MSDANRYQGKWQRSYRGRIIGAGAGPVVEDPHQGRLIILVYRAMGWLQLPIRAREVQWALG